MFQTFLNGLYRFQVQEFPWVVPRIVELDFYGNINTETSRNLNLMLLFL